MIFFSVYFVVSVYCLCTFGGFTAKVRIVNNREKTLEGMKLIPITVCKVSTALFQFVPTVS